MRLLGDVHTTAHSHHRQGHPGGFMTPLQRGPLGLSCMTSSTGVYIAVTWISSFLHDARVVCCATVT